MINIQNRIEKIIVDNGIVKVKISKYNRLFVIYEEFLRYYIRHNKQKLFLSEKARNQVIEFCNNY